MSWIKYISYIMYGWAALVKIHLRGPLDDCEGENPNKEGICDYGSITLISSDRYGGCEIAILLTMLLILRSLVYFALRYRAKD